MYAGYTICTSREHIVYGAFCGSTVHRDLIIYPIFPNGETLALTVYSASHNTCGASPYALKLSLNTNKGKKNGKKHTFTHSFFNYCMLCIGCHILGRFKLEITIFTFWSRKTHYKCIW